MPSIDGQHRARPSAPPEPSAVRPRISNMEIDSGALMLASVVNGLLGLVFWAAAARLYPTEEIGRATTVINAAVMIGTISNLSLGPLYERFLPQSGERGGALIVKGHLVTALIAIILSGAFLVFGPTEHLFTDTLQMALFPLCSVVLGAFALDDSILVGLRRGRWAAAKNIFHATAKLVAIVALSHSVDSTLIVSGWVVPAAIAVCVIQCAIFFRGGFLRHHRSLQDRMPSHGSLLKDFGSLYGIVIINSLAPFLLPLLVVSTLGVTEAAYFAMSWTMISAVTLVMAMISGPFVAEAAANPEDLRDLLLRQLRLLAAVALAGFVFLAFIAPFALGLVGTEYADHGAALLRSMAVVQILSIPGFVFGGLARVYRRLGYALALQITIALAVVVSAWLMLPHFGISSVGYAYVGVEFLMILGVALPLRRMVTDAMHTPSPHPHVTIGNR